MRAERVFSKIRLGPVSTGIDTDAHWLTARISKKIIFQRYMVELQAQEQVLA